MLASLVFLSISSVKVGEVENMYRNADCCFASVPCLVPVQSTNYIHTFFKELWSEGSNCNRDALDTASLNLYPERLRSYPNYTHNYTGIHPTTNVTAPMIGKRTPDYTWNFLGVEAPQTAFKYALTSQYETIEYWSQIGPSGPSVTVSPMPPVQCQVGYRKACQTYITNPDPQTLVPILTENLPWAAVSVAGDTIVRLDFDTIITHCDECELCS